MTNNKNVILSAQDIVVEFDVRDKVLTAIRGVSLELIEGEVLALVGESGSGKSTIAKILSRLLDVQEGRIHVWGESLTSLLTFRVLQKGPVHLSTASRSFSS